MRIQQSDRLTFLKNNNLLDKKLLFTAKYIKNGSSCNAAKDSMLFTHIKIDGVDYEIDHIWVKDKKLIKKYNIKQLRYVTFVGSIYELTKPSDDLYTIKKDIGIKIKEIKCH